MPLLKLQRCNCIARTRQKSGNRQFRVNQRETATVSDCYYSLTDESVGRLLMRRERMIIFWRLSFEIVRKVNLRFYITQSLQHPISA